MTAPARFTQSDVKRAASGAVAAGLAIGRIEIDPNGKITIIPAAATEKSDSNEWADLE